MICVVHQQGMSNFPSHLRIIDLISYLQGRFCVVLFQCIFRKKYKNGLMQFFGNEKNTPFTKKLFDTEQYWNSKYQVYYPYFEFNFRLPYNSCMLKICKQFVLVWLTLFQTHYVKILDTKNSEDILLLMSLIKYIRLFLNYSDLRNWNMFY